MSKFGIVKRWAVTSTLGAAIVLGAGFLESAQAQTVNYTYDALGRVHTVTYPSGVVVTYIYDAASNRVSRTVTGTFWGSFSWGSANW